MTKEQNISLASIQELYDFLCGKIPEGIRIPKNKTPRLTDEKAFSVIWYLQERMGVLPDNFELCHQCKQIYNTMNGGIFVSNLSDAKEMGYNCTRKDKGHSFCSNCR